MTDDVEATGWVVDTGADSVVGLGGVVCMGDSVVAVGARPGDGAIGESGFDPLPEGCPPPDPPDPPGALLDPEPPVPFGMTLTLPIKDFAGYSSPRPAARAARRPARCPCSTRYGAARYYRALRLEPAGTFRRPGTPVSARGGRHASAR